MILENTVEIMLSPTTIDYWLSEGYTIPTHIDSKGRLKTFKKGVTRVEVLVADLPPQSNITVSAKCIVCDVIRQVSFCSYSDTCWECNLRSQKGPKHPRYLQKVTLEGGDRSFDLYLRRVYGITMQQYLEQFKLQDYCCMICKSPQSKEGRKFSVDHNHKTLRFRGILCQHCNTAIGLIKENLEAAQRLVDYLIEDQKGNKVA